MAWCGLVVSCLLAGAGNGEDVDLSAVSTMRWIEHTVLVSETLEEIASRFGVASADVRHWNGLSATAELHRGQALRLHPTQFQPPRQESRFWIQNPVTWEELGERYHVEAELVKRANPTLARRRAPPTHRTLVVPVESGIRRMPYPRLEPGPPIAVPEGGESVGRPSLGRLEAGVQLPTSSHYEVRVPDQAFGTSLAVRSLVAAISDFRRQSGFAGPIYVGALSQLGGGPLAGHASHQSGRDVDVRLPALAFAYDKQLLARGEVDWHATFVLLDSFVRGGAVDVIFLEAKLHKYLRRAAKAMGATPAEIASVMARIRSARGHRGRIHIRFSCGAQADRCAGEHRIRAP